MTRWRCTDCGWTGNESELLSAPNPFAPEGTILGCPNCKTVDQFDEMCDEPECDQRATCGFPTPTGYRRTCFDHSAFATTKERPMPVQLCNVCYQPLHQPNHRCTTTNDHPMQPPFVPMILCPICGNKRCPHATDPALACTNSNEPGQRGSAYE
jgi:hypothetical protein